MMHKQILYFCLGSISTLGIFNSRAVSLINIASISSLLLFTYLTVRDLYPNDTNRFEMMTLLDLFVLSLGLPLEYSFLSNTILHFINFKILNIIGGSGMLFSAILVLLTLYFTTQSDVNTILKQAYLYKYVRHPLYSSISIFIISSCIYAKCFCLLGFYAFRMQNTFIGRVKEEEMNIMKTYPGYLQYKREVGSGLFFYT